MRVAYKRLPFELKAVEDAGSGWEIAGLASTFWGDPDAYGDVIAPGAFSESIATRRTKFLFEHQTPIGKELELKETDEGLYGRWSVVDTQAGSDAYKLAKAGVLDSLSIGYWPLDYEYRADGARILRKVDLFEVSAVAIPANEHAVIQSVKSGSFYAASADIVHLVTAWADRATDEHAIKTADGRREIRHVADVLRGAAERAERSAEDPPSVSALTFELDIIAARLARAGVLTGATS